MAGRRRATQETLSPSNTLRRAQLDDRTALPQVREALDRHPQAARELGDLGRSVLWTMLERDTGDSLVAFEAQRRFALELEQEIAGPSPTPLERLLAQEIVLCRFHLNSMQLASARLGSYDLAQGEFCERQIGRAQKRYLAAVKTLTQVRRLGLPAVQVNVAESGGRQFNLQCGANLHGQQSPR